MRNFEGIIFIWFRIERSFEIYISLPLTLPFRMGLSLSTILHSNKKNIENMYREATKEKIRKVDLKNVFAY